MIKQNARETKVILSFLGSSLTGELARSLKGEEIDVVRIVYESHAKDEMKQFLAALRSEHSVSVMLDTSSTSQGKICNAEPKDFLFGEKTTISLVGGKGELQIEKTPDFHKIFQEKSEVFVGYGQVCFRVEKTSKELVHLEVTQGGTVSPKMDVLVPATHKHRDTLTASDIMQAVSDIDYVVISGHLPPSEIVRMRADFEDGWGDAAPWLIAKVDSVEVYERLGELLSVVDGVMISRREIAITTNPATVPMITKEIIQRCNDRARIVVTASEMLASMRYNSTPTRAEVSDIANATIDGTDAVIISEEVAEGAHRSRAIEVAGKIIRDIERQSDTEPNWVKFAPLITNEMDAVTYHAYRTAERVGAKAVVCLTKAGNTALRLASHRVRMPIVAVTFSPKVLRRLELVRGVQSLMVDVDPKMDEVLPVVSEVLLRDSWLKSGDSIIFVAISLSPVGHDASNLFTVQTLQ